MDDDANAPHMVGAQNSSLQLRFTVRIPSGRRMGLGFRSKADLQPHNINRQPIPSAVDKACSSKNPASNPGREAARFYLIMQVPKWPKDHH